jgi:flagellar protein FlaG
MEDRIMSINPVAGTTSSYATERSMTPVAHTKTSADSVQPQVKLPVNNTKDMKLAELKGQTYSIGEEQLIIAIERANKALQGGYTSFEFSIHEGTKEIMVKVLDRDTGELIREIPSEKILDMVAKLWEMSGVLVDERR